MDLRHAARATIGALLALGLVAGPVSAETGFHPTTVLGSADSAVLGDITARGRTVAVAWNELRSVGDAILYRISLDGGATFQAQQRLDTRPNRSPALDICAGRLFIASEVQPDGSDQTVVVVGFDELASTGSGGVLISDPFADAEAMRPDIACVGDRLMAVAWLEKPAGEPWRARLRIMDLLDAKTGFTHDIDLGPARPHSVRVAATNGRVAVMWQRGGAVRLKRLSVGPGPTPTITASPTQTLASSGVNEPGGVVIDGDRVIAAYTRDSDLVVQRSTTGGATFRVRRTLLRGDGLVGVAFSIDMRGSRVLLEAGRVYADVDGGVSIQHRFRSADAGATWSSKRLGTTGQRMGAFSVRAGAPKVVEASDQWTRQPPPPRRIRFQRER